MCIVHLIAGSHPLQNPSQLSKLKSGCCRKKISEGNGHRNVIPTNSKLPRPNSFKWRRVQLKHDMRGVANCLKNKFSAEAISLVTWQLNTRFLEPRLEPTLLDPF